MTIPIPVIPGTFQFFTAVLQKAEMHPMGQSSSRIHLLCGMKRLIFLLFILSASTAWSQRIPNPRPFAKSITVENLRRQLFTIADAEMEGRETATEGQRKAANYIENEFRSLGLSPGNKDRYQMYFPVFIDSLLELSFSLNNMPRVAGEDFTVNVSSSHPAAFRFSEAVLAGYGRSSAAHDDYKGTDLKGKLVMVWSDDTTGSRMPGTPVRYNSYAQEATAVKNGAAALLVISNNITPPAVKSNMFVNPYQKTQRLPTYYISEKLAREIIGSRYNELKASARQETFVTQTIGAEIALTFNKSLVHLQSSNVLGLLEGTDLKDEYVVLTAHYDHLGKRNGTIWFGADDDGSGTSAVIELARAFTKARAAGRGPRRSILFMTVSGEEKGLWGSDYYSEHPALPLDKTSVNLNIDMIGRIDPGRNYGDSTNYVYVIGDDKLSSDLKPISESINKKYSKLELDYKYNDPQDPERIYYRSDHYNFAKKGVPVIFYFSGLHPDYHKPSDTPEKINFTLLQKRTQFIFFTAWEMANRNDMLKRDIPLPE